MNYYNDNDPFICAWLAELIKEGLIPDGEIDARSIKEVQPKDLRGFHQCHFFAGIGGWPFALRLAGWPDEKPVWTGSCPCQPFSNAGKGQGIHDERHLWPEWLRLVRAERPPVIFGEQVASKDGKVWLAGVHSDLEAGAYSFGAADLCAAGIGAPHIRQRLYWVADAKDATRRSEFEAERARCRRTRSGGSGEIDGLADAHGGHVGNGRLQRSGKHRQQQKNSKVVGMGDAPGGRFGKRGNAKKSRCGGHADGTIAIDGLGNVDGSGWSKQRGAFAVEQAQQAFERGNGGLWETASWVRCEDGRARRVEPGIQPLAHSRAFRNRLGTLRGAGNAIVPWLAAEFIAAAREAMSR